MNRHAPKMSRYLPQALAATVIVVAGPVAAVWALRAGQIVGSTVLAVGIGMVLSMTVSFAGSAYWASSASSQDILFSELMIWGWLRRWRAERKLTAALGRLSDPCDISESAGAGRQLALLKDLAAALEAGDPYVHGHSRRVARYASMIAARMGLPAAEVDRIRTAAAVHDVGKVQTPIEILHKPGRLTDDEYTVIKRHPVDGARLVEALGDDRLTAIVRHHHERLDGRGYPDGLAGEEIPLGARIVAVADTFDAITSARSYRAASPHRKALDILIKESGAQLDTDAVRAFRACYMGRRPFALWMGLLAFPQRLGSSLGNGATATTVSLGKAVATASAVAVMSGAVATAAPLVASDAASRATTAARPAVAAASPSRAASPQGGAAAAAAPGAELVIAAGPSEHPAQRGVGTMLRRFPRSRTGAGSGAGRPSGVLHSGQAMPAAAGPPAGGGSSARPGASGYSRSTAPTPATARAADHLTSSTASPAPPAPAGRPANSGQGSAGKGTARTGTAGQGTAGPASAGAGTAGTASGGKSGVGTGTATGDGQGSAVQPSGNGAITEAGTAGAGAGSGTTAASGTAGGTADAPGSGAGANGTAPAGDSVMGTGNASPAAGQ